MPDLFLFESDVCSLKTASLVSSLSLSLSPPPSLPPSLLSVSRVLVLVLGTIHCENEAAMRAKPKTVPTVVPKFPHPWIENPDETFEKRGGIYAPHSKFELLASQGVLSLSTKLQRSPDSFLKKWQDRKVRGKWMTEIENEVLREYPNFTVSAKAVSKWVEAEIENLLKIQHSGESMLPLPLHGLYSGWAGDAERTPALRLLGHLAQLREAERTVQRKGGKGKEGEERPKEKNKDKSKKQKQKEGKRMEKSLEERMDRRVARNKNEAQKAERQTLINCAEAHPDDSGLFDWIHPSWYPRPVSKKLKKLKNLKKLKRETEEEKKEKENSKFAAKSFAWIPTLVDILPPPAVPFALPLSKSSSLGREWKCQIKGYINNLHPTLHGCYSDLEELLALSLPAFNKVLQELSDEKMFGLPRWNSSCSYTEAREEVNNIFEAADEDGGKEGEMENVEAKMIWRMEKYQPRILWSPRPISTASPNILHPGGSFKVFVKVATIHLTPESPKYSGTSWHVEGTTTENILATWILYLEEENVTDSFIEFRVPVNDPDYEQGDDEGVQILYGLSSGDALLQKLGQVQTCVGRILCFPNTLQHRVLPFALRDTSKPGKRSFLLFWITGPSSSPSSSRPLGERETTTMLVAPRQRHWYEGGGGILANAKTRALFFSSPFPSQVKLKRLYAESVSRKEARQEVLLLMSERKKLDKEFKRTMKKSAVSPCVNTEH